MASNDNLSSMSDRQLLLAIYSELKAGLAQNAAGLAGVETALRDLAREQHATAGRTDALIVDVRDLMAGARTTKAELKLARDRVLDLEQHGNGAGKRAGATRRG
jgi:hypothetical protein